MEEVDDALESSWEVVDDSHKNCLLIESSCALDQLTKGQRTYIYSPGSEHTGCIAGSPYRFEVNQGEEFPNKVVVFFQGGGGKYYHMMR